MNLEPHSRAWSLFWLLWFLVPLAVFLVAEIYALCTDWRNTLSAQVWRMLAVKQGQPVPQWTVGHVWFAVIWLGLTVWLTGHFLAGWWRG